MLRSDNVKGSFNGTDIMTEYDGLTNEPRNFEQLFALHAAFSWPENLARLVEATTAIVGRDNRFHATDLQRQQVLTAPERALSVMESEGFKSFEAELGQLISQRSENILEASQLQNVNLRGNAIEQILTGAGNTHALGDIERQVQGSILVVDIKTTLLDRASAPKAYNVDKMLHFLSQPGSVLAFLMVWVDVEAASIVTRLLPVLEESILKATVVQHHWAGRSSRGVTQLSGAFSQAIKPDYRPSIDLPNAKTFLKRLLDL
jgi:hypothetical protein